MPAGRRSRRCRFSPDRPARAAGRSRVLRGRRDHARRPLHRRRSARQDEPRDREDRLARVAPRCRPGRKAGMPCCRTGLRAMGWQRSARVPDAGCDLQRCARRPSSLRARDRRRALLPHRLARLLGAPARGGRPRGRADRDLAAAPGVSRRRAAARRDEPDRDRDSELGREAARRRRLDGTVTHGDVLAGTAEPEELVPFGGDRAHKAFALAVGLEMLVAALAGEEHGALLLVAKPEHDPVPGLRTLAEGTRLPGDR